MSSTSLPDGNSLTPCLALLNPSARVLHSIGRGGVDSERDNLAYTPPAAAYPLPLNQDVVEQIHYEDGSQHKIY